MINQMELIRIVKRGDSFEVYSTRREMLVAIFFSEAMLRNVLEMVYGLDAMDSMPIEEDERWMACKQCRLIKTAYAHNPDNPKRHDFVSGVPDKKKKSQPKQRDAYRDALTKYQMTTDSREDADKLHIKVATQSIYVELVRRGLNYILTAFPFTEDEAKWLEDNGWKLA